MAENPDSGYNGIVARFGTPQQIAAAYVDEQETSELLNDMRIKTKIMGMATIAASLVFFLWLAVVTLVYIEGCNNVNGTGAVTGIEVIYEETYPD